MTDSHVSSGGIPVYGEPWWQGEDTLRRYLADLLASEVKRVRPDRHLPSGQMLALETRLDEEGLGFDSLERLDLAAAVSEALHLHEGGLGDFLLATSTVGEWRDVAAASLERYSTSVTFRTSGSTGLPKSCSHALACLEQEVEVLADLLSSGQRVLSAVPAHHIYGFLFTVLLPLRIGRVPVLDIRSHSPGAVAAIAQPDDIVIGHPAFWAAVARSARSGWPPRVTGVTSTGPCPPETASALREAGLLRFLQIHGSSEIAGLGWRDDAHGPYRLMPHWSRGPGESLLRTSPEGGLLQEIEAIASPDQLDWLDERRYQVSGRLDGAVQVGGVNVFPHHVVEVLGRHPGVAAISVRLMRPNEGIRLKAFVLTGSPASEHEVLRGELEALAFAELTTPEQPHAYSFGDALPTGPMGKPTDWEITWDGSDPAAGS